MLKSISTIAYLCSNKAKPNLVKITAEFRGKEYIYHFAENTKLAPNFERARVPLECECGFSCNCGTCAISLSEPDF